MLQRMKRIQIIGPKGDLNRAVDVLYNAGTVHLEDAPSLISPDEIPLIPVKLETVNDISEVLGKINGIFGTLPRTADDPEGRQKVRASLENKSHNELIAKARDIIRELETTTRDLTAKKSELTLSITALNRYARVLEIIQPVEKELPLLEGFEITILLIQKEHSEVLEIIRKELNTLTHDQFEMTSTTVDADTLAAIMVFNRRYSEQVHSFIYSVNVNEVRLPQEYSGRPFYEMFALIGESKLRAQEDIRKIDEQLLTLASVWYQELVVLKKRLEDINGELGAYRNFGLSEYIFVIMGWIPKKYLQRTRLAVREVFGERVAVIELDPSGKEMENAPVFYDNPWWVKPFEFIMQLVSPPRYREVDPSPILAIFFPIFFGMMVGDIGYGLIIFFFALALKNRFKKLDFIVSLSGILMISSIPTIIFGFLYGEFFGDLGESLGWLHPVTFLGITWNRTEAVIPMLLFAITVGVIHVLLGLVIGIRNAVITKSRKHLCEKCGMLFMIIAIIALILVLGGFIPQGGMYPAVLLIVVALPLIIYGAGVFGTIEIMSTVGNILSYARLMAIGMASVILAMVANQLGGALGFVIIGVIVAILLHALNIVLAMFSPSIHSVRLHLVEFFSKFYEGGGIVYRPFKKEIAEVNPPPPSPQ